VNWSQPFPVGSEHRANTEHHFGDFDLTVFPESQKLRLRFGYSFSDTNGPAFNTLRFKSDEYMVSQDVDNKSQDFRAGIEGELLGFNIGGLYGHRSFDDRNRYFLNSFSPGNSPLSSSSFLNYMTRTMPVKGTTDFGNFYIQRTFAKKFDFSGRFIYSESVSKSTQSDTLNGRVSSTGDLIILDAISAPAKTSRPQARGDIGMTWRATDKFRVSNTFTFDQFSIGGLENFFETILSSTSAGVPNSPVPTRTLASTATSYRRFSNLIEADYQINRMFAFNVGYRYTHRNVFNNEDDLNLVTGAPTIGERETLTNSTNSIIAGARIKPTKSWSIFADVEHGDADNVFTRLANNKYTNFRVRSMASVKQVTFNLSYIGKNNDSPGTSEPVTSSGGFPATETNAVTKLHIFSGSFDWTPRPDLTISSGYTYNFQNTKTDVIVPVGAPVRSTTAWFLGLSAYYQRDSYFFVDVDAHPFKRVGLFASYRFDHDPGQGDRVITRPQDLIYSYPFTNHMPEIRLAIKLTKNIDWNVGYQYYSYHERQYVSPFGSINTTTLIPQGIAPQNYTAHMPYTSLRFYFGRAAADR
jgi:hypothetical protein